MNHFSHLKYFFSFLEKLKMSHFEWPWQYNFPPFFTLQKHQETREKQIDQWISLGSDLYFFFWRIVRDSCSTWT